jgi:hypothetical protein
MNVPMRCSISKQSGEEINRMSVHEILEDIGDGFMKYSKGEVITSLSGLKMLIGGIWPSEWCCCTMGRSVLHRSKRWLEIRSLLTLLVVIKLIHGASGAK